MFICTYVGPCLNVDFCKRDMAISWIIFESKHGDYSEPAQ